MFDSDFVRVNFSGKKPSDSKMMVYKSKIYDCKIDDAIAFTFEDRGEVLNERTDLLNFKADDINELLIEEGFPLNENGIKSRAHREMILKKYR